MSAAPGEAEAARVKAEGARSGPAVVGMGGGHGLAASLQAIRRYAGEVTAVVSVADDGGSSGRLRQALGVPAPGDLRRCLVALAAEPDEEMWCRALEHRFGAGELAGHALGNLLIAGLAAVTGSFTAALDEVGALVGAVGRVLPASLEPVVVKARVGEREVAGQVAVETAGAVTGGTVTDVWLDPPGAKPPPEALDAIAAADQIVLGPGSLFTSVVAVLAVPDLAAAVRDADATVVYVANLRATPDIGDLDVAGHVAALAAHGVRPDVVVADPAGPPIGALGIEAVAERVSNPDRAVHDPDLLGEVLKRYCARMYEERPSRDT